MTEEGKYFEELTDQMVTTYADDPHLALALMQLRMMMAHHQVGIGELASLTGCSRSWAFKVLRGGWVSKKYTWIWLDKFDDAMDCIITKRGGIPTACCGEEGYAAIKEVLANA